MAKVLFMGNLRAIEGITKCLTGLKNLKERTLESVYETGMVRTAQNKNDNCVPIMILTHIEYIKAEKQQKTKLKLVNSLRSYSADGTDNSQASV